MNIVFIDIFDTKEILNISSYGKNSINILTLKLNKKLIEKLVLFDKYISNKNKKKTIKKYIKDKNELSTFKIDNLFCYISCVYYYILSYIYSRKLKKYINDDSIIIYSKEIQKSNLVKYINKYLLNLCKYKVIKHQNTIKYNVFRNIDLFIKNNNLDINKLKILLIVDNISNLDYNKIIEYIQKYKFIDILCIRDVLIDTKDKISNINNEYGTSIEIINRVNILNYDIYINIDVNKKYFLEHYIVNKKSKYIDINDSTTDEYNSLYINFNEYVEKNNFNILVDIYRYNMLDIGYVCQKYKDLTNSI